MKTQTHITNTGSRRPDADLDAQLEPTGALQASIRDFRSAVHHIAQLETSQPVPANWLAPAQGRRRTAQRRLMLAWTCSALLCAGIVPLSTHLHQTQQAQQQAQQQAATQSYAADTALLEQVDSAVSESVPSSLAPLTALDSWSSSTSTNESSTNPMEKTNAAQ
jgi:predicted anti-sigma-YlaC factor YlaD